MTDTGESARTLQHWSDLGLLRPLPATNKQGRGYHREFPASAPYHGERTWALMASEMNRLRIPLRDIKVILDSFRASTTDAHPKEPPVDWAKSLGVHLIGRALNGHLVLLAIHVGEDRLAYGELLIDKPGLASMIFVKDDVGRDITYVEARVSHDFILTVSSSYLINVSKVLSPLTGWSP